MGAMEGVESSSLEVEVMAKPTRRRYTAEYKLRILREAEVSSGRGELGALLRREGLYSSNLTAWRKQRERGELEGLSRKRGPAPKPRNPLADRVRALERENTRLKARAERAEGLLTYPCPTPKVSPLSSIMNSRFCGTSRSCSASSAENSRIESLTSKLTLE